MAAALPASHAPPPPGLSCLSALGRVSVRQNTTVFAGNKYVVIAPGQGGGGGGVGGGAPLLYAREDSGFFQLLGGKTRPFNIDLFDAHQRPVASLRRPYTFGPDKMDVCAGGALVAVVRQQTTFLKPVLSINDAHDRPVLRVKGPAVTTGEANFDIFTQDKRQIGVIRKVWSGAARELLTSSDSFQIQFPQELEERFKAAIIGTCFLIDFLYYEN